ncbi:MAG TPA: polysaccharide biosynthesis/export family protein [Gemmatimonadaceae bacterium]
MRVFFVLPWLTAAAVMTARPALAQSNASSTLRRAAPSHDSTTALRAADAAVLHPGDMVKVTVWRSPEMSGDFIVGATGTLQHPLYQSVPVAGLPLGEVVQRLQKFLSHYQEDPQLVVVPLFRVTVGGEVRLPNLYSLPTETTISQAVAQAGGATQDGRLDKVRILRAGHEYTADLTRADGTWANTPIQSGDQILVARKGSFWRDLFLPAIAIGGSIASIVNVVRR